MARTLAALALVLSTLDLAAAVSGHAVDEDGKPLAGVRVRAVAPELLESLHDRLTSAAPDPVAIGEAQTGTDGAFRIDVKRQPVVTLIAEAAGRAPVMQEVVDGDAATLQLIAYPARTGRVTANRKPVANALVILNNQFLLRTSESGEFTIPDPKTWLTRLLVVHPDFATFEKLRGRDSWSSLDVALEPGQQVRGRVVDPAGRPVANAIVRRDSWPIAKSGEDGSFTIEHLPANVRALTAREGNRIGSAKPAAEMTITLRPGATIGGSLRSSKDDVPVPAAVITVRSTDTTRLGSAITDAKGNFAVDGILPGMVQLSFSHPAYAGASLNDVTANEGARTDRAMVATPSAKLAGVVIDEEKKPVGGARVAAMGMLAVVSAPDGSFSTRWPPSERPVLIEVTKSAYAGATHGPLRLEAGESRTGVRIVLPRGTKFEFRLVDRDGVGIADEPVTIVRKTDPEERFRVMPVRCGGAFDPMSCRSDASGKLVVNLADDVYDIRAGGTTTIQRELPAQKLSAAVSPLMIELERGATIEGRVVWSDGAPFTAFATVSAGTQSGGGPVTEGAFTLRNVKAGKTILTAQTGPPSFMTSEPVEVMAPATGVVLKIARPGRIEGRVVERDNQRAITQFSVSAEGRARNRPPTSQKAINAADGKFVLEDVPPGSVDVIVTAPGYVRSATSAVEVIEGKATTVEIALEKAGTVVGRVTSDGRPVPGVTIATTERRGPRLSSAKQTDANGEYVLDTVPGGSQELTFRRQGYVTKVLTVTVSAGKEVRGDVELARGRELQGRVVDTAGRPIASAEIMWGVGARPSFETRIQSDADGLFKLEGLGDQAITVSARKSGYAEGSVEVNPAVATTVTITLDRGGSISGRVIGLPAAELQGLEIWASAMGGGGMPGGLRATTDATGAFTLSGTRDGDYAISAQQTSPPRRRASAPRVKVTGGVAPFVEIDFSAGISVRGRVTRRGAPVQRGMVHMLPTDPAARGANSSGGDIGLDGTYELRVPASGEYRVLVSLHDASIGTNEAGKVDVRGETTHDIDIRGGAVRARVVDAASGVPLPDVTVLLIGEGRGGTDRVTDSAGRAIFDFVSDGKYSVRTNKIGYATEVREIVVQNGVDAEVEVAIARGEQIVVRLIEAGTGNVADAYATIVDVGGKVVADRPFAREADGSMRFFVHPGNYTVRAAGRNYEPKIVPAVVPGTPVVTIELVRIQR